MRDVKRGALTAAAVATVAALAGCGVVDGVVDKVRYPYAKESAETIFLDSVTATMSLESVRVSGFLDVDGKPRVQFNLLGTEDERCGGTIEFETADFDLVWAGKVMYFRGSAGSWQQLPGLASEQRAAAAPVLADRWIEVDDKDDLEARRLCGFAAELLTPAEQKAVDAGKVPENLQLTHHGLSEAAGVKAVKLQVVDKRTTSDVWVSLEEPHYIVKMTSKDKRGNAEVVFSDYDFPGEVRVPAKKDIVDPEDLTARSG